MSKAAFHGALVNIRNVASHKSVALTVEFPQEFAQEIVQAFGWPTQVNPVSVALARLILEAPKPPEPPKPPKPPKPKREWEHLPLSERAGMLSEDPIFMQFAGVEYAGEAADFIRQKCNVTSRANIRYGTAAGADYLALERAFWAWRDEPAEAVGADHD